MIYPSPCLAYYMFNIATFILLHCVGSILFHTGRPLLNIPCADSLCYIIFIFDIINQVEVHD